MVKSQKRNFLLPASQRWVEAMKVLKLKFQGPSLVGSPYTDPGTMYSHRQMFL